MIYLAGFVVVLVLFIGFVSRGGGALWIVHVREGELQVRRGTPSRRLIDDLTDALKGTDRATLRAFRVDRHVELKTSGSIDAPVEQRLRNIVGMHYG